jgi:DNA-binding response OmpR family regulator
MRNEGILMTDEKKKIYIHIVEDNAFQAKMLKRLLEKNEYEVIHTEDGQYALESIQERTPDLVISDVNMPRMDGFELCLKLRNIPKFVDLPIILLTTLSSPEDVIHATRCHADDFITKPFQKQFLLIRVEKILGIHPDSNNPEDLEEEEMGSLMKPDIKRMATLLSSVYEEAIQKNEQLQTACWKLEDLYSELKVKNECLATLQEQKEQLAELNARKNRFLGIAAHDLRNPLNNIMLTNDLLVNMDSDNLTEEQVELLNGVQNASEFMLSMVGLDHRFVK